MVLSGFRNAFGQQKQVSVLGLRFSAAGFRGGHRKLVVGASRRRLRPISLCLSTSTSGKVKETCTNSKSACGSKVDITEQNRSHAEVPQSNVAQTISWTCRSTWKRAAINTSWCLLGCSIGEFGTLGAFQVYYGDGGLVSPTMVTIVLPVVNGLITSVALETAILRYGTSSLSMPEAFKTAMGMSFISMVSMELAMEITDYMLTGGMQMQAWAIPPMLFMGFITPLPFNYWRLKKYGKSCH